MAVAKPQMRCGARPAPARSSNKLRKHKVLLGESSILHILDFILAEVYSLPARSVDRAADVSALMSFQYR
ncbi:hypothetical protein EVAR_67704_1 [Eumeta japonica]|uniref:Uncharacterized protein n=1 Tax=Eumeta variegata TaxID=151549 RepID=A0A4C2A4L1_EUMVA|nr:hypothetical protein EVAR_67704_1 [Eumeta japonica]